MLRLLQVIDRRVLYVMLLLAVTIPFFLNFTIPVSISPRTRAVYDKIESLPEGSFVLFGVDWSASTRGENAPQTEALMRHLMRKKLRFGIIAFGDVQSETLGQEIAVRLQTEYGFEEGRDWINFGYQPAAAQENFLKSMAQDMVEAIKKDRHGKPIADQPVMKGIKTPRDCALLIDVTPSHTYQIYIQFLQGPCNLPMVVGPTAVMAPETYNYMDSKQILGVLNGLQGAIEYEQLIEKPGKASRASLSSSFAHILIMFLIVVGNIAMLLERRQRRRENE